MNMTIVLPNGGELIYDASDIVPVADKGLPRTVLYRRPSVDRQPRYEITIEVQNGVPVIAEFKVKADPGAHIRAKDVKVGTVGLDRLLPDWLERVTHQPGAAAGYPEHDWIRNVRVPIDPDARRSALRTIAQAQRPLRRRMTDDDLREVTRIYNGDHPAKHEAVSMAFHVTERTAQRYIEKARAAGFLPPSDRTRK